MVKIAAQDENFSEAEAQFDLNRLKVALVSQEAGDIPEAPWRYFKGVLCGFETKEVAEKCHVTEKTVQVALNRDVKECLLRLLQRSDKERISNWSIVRQWVIDAGYGSGENQRIDWQEVCRGMLDLQIQSPTLNYLMAKDGICIDPNTLFVPVGLVERKQKQYRRSDIGSAEQGSQLLQPTEEEIVKRFDHEEQFFTQVICNPDIADGARLVITGEPGSGKTTLLQKIGDRLLKAEMFPIWISLGKQGVAPTYEFLSRVLKTNAQPQTVDSSDWDTSINALLQTGKVWLLLDGADELTVNGSPLHVIADQVREAWANQVKVVLTCRLNAWDTHALPKFQVFRTLEFDYQTAVDDYPNQVEAYIHKFFSRESVDSQLGHSLIQQLYKAGKERIRDSVKNPLRLSLLCYVWESGIGELPDTKAELYRLFVDYYYELQERKYTDLRIDRTERDALNLALGEVAKAALDSKDSRFRLRKSLIESVPAMGQSDAKNSLFYKAIQLGWLNYIGTIAEKPHEPAYAFLHPTFQEYFAALAIDDWGYFLPCDHIDAPVNSKRYRIFESHWKEIILLWLGCSFEQIPQDVKESFIKQLIDFKDCFGGVYAYQAYFLGAEGIIEFHSSRSEDIIAQIVQWAFGWFDFNDRAWKISFITERKAIEILQRLHPKAKNELNKLLFLARSSEIRDAIRKNGNSYDEILIGKIALMLLEASPNHLEAIKAIKELIEDDQSQLKVFYPEVSNEEKLVEAFKESPLWKNRIKENPRPSLSKSFSIEEVTDLLNRLRNIQDGDPNHSNVLSRLEEFSTNNLEIIPVFTNFIHQFILTKQTASNYSLFVILQYMKTSLTANQEAAEVLMQLLSERLDFGIYSYGITLHALSSLSVMGFGDRKALSFLLKLVHDESDWTIRTNALGCLPAVLTKDLFELAVPNLRFLLEDPTFEKDRGLSSNCYGVLWYCAQNMSYSDFFNAWRKPNLFIDFEEDNRENSEYRGL